MTLEIKKEELPVKDFAFGDLVESVRKRAVKVEVINIEGRKSVYNFYNPDGIEIGDLVDPEHSLSVNKFTTIVVSQAFDTMRGEEAVPDGEIDGVKEAPVSATYLSTISDVASDKRNYGNTPGARENRKIYRRWAATALHKVHAFNPFGNGDIRVGVKRCGSNLLDEIERSWESRDRRIKGGCERVDIQAKRIRFKGLNSVLGAGVNIDDEVAEKFKWKHVRLQEGVVAAGTTEAVVMAEVVRNRGIKVKGISCDAVVVCPTGGEFVSEFRKALQIGGQDTAAYVGGYLDENWYVRYGKVKERLIEKLRMVMGDLAENYRGLQIVGDGGDLSTK